jgi:hypothetical protein
MRVVEDEVFELVVRSGVNARTVVLVLCYSCHNDHSTLNPHSCHTQYATHFFR